MAFVKHTQHTKAAHEHDNETHALFRAIASSTKKHGETLGRVDSAATILRRHHVESKPGHVEHHMHAKQLHLELAKVANELEASAREHMHQAQELRKLCNDGAQKHHKAIVSIKAAQ